MKVTLFVLSVIACLFSLARPVRAESGVLNFDVLDSSSAIARSNDPPMTSETAKNSTIALTFPEQRVEEIPPIAAVLPEKSDRPAAPTDANTDAKQILAQKPADATVTTAEKTAMFNGGSESLVARAVGAAEGTRTADGTKTQNYYGHVDPGDGKWNVGTFSYNNTRDGTNITTPEAADAHYLDRLQERAAVIQSKAEQSGIDLTFAEWLNGIDLANQAPRAVMEEGGFVERLAEAKHTKGLSGQAAILESRVWAFWDPQKGGWDAPGLRAYDDISKAESIRRDQERRMLAIADALAVYQQQK
jgi:hypothetical protein